MLLQASKAASENEKEILIKEIISKLTLKEKIGQLFIIRPESLDPSLNCEQVESLYEYGCKNISPQMKSFYNEYPAGGFIIFGKNIASPSQLKNLNDSIHSLSPLYPLIYTDEEGGRVTRLARVKRLHIKKTPPMAEIGETQNPQKAYIAAFKISKYLKKYKIDVDFAPVADINSNPKNKVIGDRAFSSDPTSAGEMLVSFIKGLNANGFQGCLKHYPGHGDTENDTHHGYAETKKTWQELLDCELISFKAGIECGTNFIMTAHISAPKITGDTIPATLSIELLENLRNELNYKGVIVSDAMNMGAIKNNFENDESTVLAILAGINCILMPFDYRSSFEAVLKAVEEGLISEKRIDYSVERILKTKISALSS